MEIHRFNMMKKDPTKKNKHMQTPKPKDAAMAPGNKALLMDNNT